MITVSDAFKNQMKEHRDFIYSALVKPTKGNQFTLTENDLCVDNCNIGFSTNGSTFPIGQAIGKTLSLQFYNVDDRFKDYDFLEGAVTVFLQFVDGESKISLGEFTVISPETYGAVITLTACDDMYKADRKLSRTIAFPANLLTLFRQVCADCGIAASSATFPNSDYTVESLPDDVSCRELLGMIAMFAGGNVVISGSGMAYIQTFGGSRLPEEKFNENANLQISTDQVTITGISAKNDSNETVLVGEEGYVLEVENKLFDKYLRSCLTRIANQVQGLTFWVFSTDHTPYPIIEFGDKCNVIDVDGVEHVSHITDFTINFKGYTHIECKAENPLRNRQKGNYSSANYSTIQRHVTQQLTENQQSYNAAMQRLGRLVANSFGLHHTEEDGEDGGKIYYFHNANTLKDSTTIWRLSADAFTVSTDGGKTWNAGIDKNGNAIVNMLSAVGINADWIIAGTISGINITGSHINGGDVMISGETSTPSEDHGGAKDVTELSKVIYINEDGTVWRAAGSEIASFDVVTGKGISSNLGRTGLALKLQNNTDFYIVTEDSYGKLADAYRFAKSAKEGFTSSDRVHQFYSDMYLPKGNDIVFEQCSEDSRFKTNAIRYSGIKYDGNYSSTTTCYTCLVGPLIYVFLKVESNIEVSSYSSVQSGLSVSVPIGTTMVSTVSGGVAIEVNGNSIRALSSGTVKAGSYYAICPAHKY